MSTGRFCDVQIAKECPSRPPYHGVFSELADDWDTFSGARMKRDSTTGKRFSESVSQDSCPFCTAVRENRYNAAQSEPEPPKAIKGHVADGRQTVDAEEYAAYQKWLEDQALGDDKP